MLKQKQSKSTRALSDYLQSWQERNKRLWKGPETTVEGLRVSVRKSVFSPDPDLTNSTSFLIRCLPAIRGKSFLDLGTGCGVVAAYAALNGAQSVSAVDIQEESLHNAAENFSTLGLSQEIDLVESDVFQNVCGRFDVIAANLPFMVSGYNMNRIACETYLRFFDRLEDHLTADGLALLTFASWGDLGTLTAMINDCRLPWQSMTECTGDITWYVFQIGHIGTTAAEGTTLL